jgi:hypothetical protein
MSPEQLSGDVLDGRSDLYSLALVFYRLLTGTFPFPSESSQEMMIKRLTDDPQPLDIARPGVRHPAALQQVMDRALARMPRDRYAGAVQFAQDAGTAAAGWAAASDGGAEGATQIIGAPPAGSDATVQLAPTQVRRPSAPATPTTPRPLTSPPVPTGKRKTPALAIAAAVVLLGGGGVTAMMLGGGGGGDPGTDSLRVAADTQVTGDTAARAADGQDSRRGNEGPGPVRPVTAESSTVAPPPVDLTAIRAELVRLGREISDEGTRSSAIRRATELSDQTSLPDSMRARAAQLAAEGHDEAGNTTEACRLNAEAIRLEPGNRLYVQARNVLFACPQ